MLDATTSERTDSKRRTNDIRWFNGEPSDSYAKRWGFVLLPHRLLSLDSELIGFSGCTPCRMVLPASSNYRYDGSASSRLSPFVQEFYAAAPEKIFGAPSVIENLYVLVQDSPTSVKGGVLMGLSPSEVCSPAAQPQMSSLPVSPVVNPMDITHQLTDLRKLRDGWADGMQLAHQWGRGYGKAPSAAGLDWLIRQFGTNYDIHLPRPYLYPTPEGGVQAEWSLGDHEVSLEIDLVRHTGDWHCFETRTGQSTERDLDLDDVASWKWLADQLLQLESDGE